MKFSEFELTKEILEGLEQAGFSEATQVQERTLTEVLRNGRDVTVQSQTGTGKTAAFLLPAYQLMLTDPKHNGRKALILAPTRELAVQIDEEAKLLGTFLPFKMAAFYGGVGYGQQEEQLKRGVDIVVATPGRLLDFISSKKINPKDFSILVIDEADRLLDMGFYPDIKRLFGKLVARQERRTFLLSATMSTRVSAIAWEHMNDPAEIIIEAERITVDAIDQKLYHVASDEKMSVLLGILAQEKPASCVVFANTKRKTEEVAKRLELNGYKAHYIMGDMPQKKRLAIINEVKAGTVSFLVATDVAARGLHIDDLDMVVNYDLPEDSENYVHRIGRTARAGKTGKAVSLACEHFVYALAGIEKFIGNKIPVAAITDTLLVEDKSRGTRIQLSVWDEDGEEVPGLDRRNQTRGPVGRGRGGIRQQTAQRGQGPTARSGQDNRQGRPYGDRGRGPGGAQVDRQRQDRPRPEHQHQDRNRQDQQKIARPGGGAPRGQSAEERLAYYRQKYGESFVPTPELLERLRRDEQRAKDKGNRVERAAAVAGKPGSRPHQNTQQNQQRGTPARHTNPAHQKNQSGKTGQTAQKSRVSQAPRQSVQQRPGSQAQQNKPLPTAKQGGLIGWIKGLFNPKK